MKVLIQLIDVFTCVITSTLCLVVKKIKGNKENLETHQKHNSINPNNRIANFFQMGFIIFK